jgi:hypothetical protein
VVSKSRPVIVWIHGGNFGRGSASEYEPDYILDHEVVLVTIQYRWDLEYEPDYILDHEVVLVTIQYRWDLQYEPEYILDHEVVLVTIQYR